MTITNRPKLSAGETLCRYCGLCCTGHLFESARLGADEAAFPRSMGMQVRIAEGESSGHFLLPCPLWRKHCSIYSHPLKPQVCSSYQCELLKNVHSGSFSLQRALATVVRIKKMISGLEMALPIAQGENFRKRLLDSIGLLERSAENGDSKAGKILFESGILLAKFSRIYGVINLFNDPEQRSLEG